MNLALKVLFSGVLTILPVWVINEGCSFVGKAFSEVIEFSMPALSTGISLAFFD